MIACSDINIFLTISLKKQAKNVEVLKYKMCVWACKKLSFYKALAKSSGLPMRSDFFVLIKEGWKGGSGVLSQNCKKCFIKAMFLVWPKHTFTLL